MISNNNELPKFEDIFDPADDFEFIDKKEVERLMKEDRLRESTNSKKITFNKLSEVISNSLQVKSKNVLKPKKKSQGGCKSAIAVLGDGLEYKWTLNIRRLILVFIKERLFIINCLYKVIVLFKMSNMFTTSFYFNISLYLLL